METAVKKKWKQTRQKSLNRTMQYGNSMTLKKIDNILEV